GEIIPSINSKLPEAKKIAENVIDKQTYLDFIKQAFNEVINDMGENKDFYKNNFKLNSGESGGTEGSIVIKDINSELVNNMSELYRYLSSQLELKVNLKTQGKILNNFAQDAIKTIAEEQSKILADRELIDKKIINKRALKTKLLEQIDNATIALIGNSGFELDVDCKYKPSTTSNADVGVTFLDGVYNNGGNLLELPKRLADMSASLDSELGKIMNEDSNFILKKETIINEQTVATEETIDDETIKSVKTILNETINKLKNNYQNSMNSVVSEVNTYQSQLFNFKNRVKDVSIECLNKWVDGMEENGHLTKTTTNATIGEDSSIVFSEEFIKANIKSIVENDFIFFDGKFTEYLDDNIQTLCIKQAIKDSPLQAENIKSIFSEQINKINKIRIESNKKALTELKEKASNEVITEPQLVQFREKAFNNWISTNTQFTNAFSFIKDKDNNNRGSILINEGFINSIISSSPNKLSNSLAELSSKYKELKEVVEYGTTQSINGKPLLQAAENRKASVSAIETNIADQREFISSTVNTISLSFSQPSQLLESIKNKLTNEYGCAIANERDITINQNGVLTFSEQFIKANVKAIKEKEVEKNLKSFIDDKLDDAIKQSFKNATIEQGLNKSSIIKITTALGNNFKSGLNGLSVLEELKGELRTAIDANMRKVLSNGLFLSSPPNTKVTFNLLRDETSNEVDFSKNFSIGDDLSIKFTDDFIAKNSNFFIKCGINFSSPQAKELIKHIDIEGITNSIKNSENYQSIGSEEIDGILKQVNSNNKKEIARAVNFSTYSVVMDARYIELKKQAFNKVLENGTFEGKKYSEYKFISLDNISRFSYINCLKLNQGNAQGIEPLKLLNLYKAFTTAVDTELSILIKDNGKQNRLGQEAELVAQTCKEKEDRVVKILEGYQKRTALIEDLQGDEYQTLRDSGFTYSPISFKKTDGDPAIQLAQLKKLFANATELTVNKIGTNYKQDFTKFLSDNGITGAEEKFINELNAKVENVKKSFPKLIETEIISLINDTEEYSIFKDKIGTSGEILIVQGEHLGSVCFNKNNSKECNLDKLKKLKEIREEAYKKAVEKAKKQGIYSESIIKDIIETIRANEKQEDDLYALSIKTRQNNLRLDFAKKTIMDEDKYSPLRDETNGDKVDFFNKTSNGSPLIRLIEPSPTPSKLILIRDLQQESADKAIKEAEKVNIFEEGLFQEAITAEEAKLKTTIEKLDAVELRQRELLSDNLTEDFYQALNVGTEQSITDFANKHIRKADALQTLISKLSKSTNITISCLEVIGKDNIQVMDELKDVLKKEMESIEIIKSLLKPKPALTEEQIKNNLKEIRQNKLTLLLEDSKYASIKDKTLLSISNSEDMSDILTFKGKISLADGENILLLQDLLKESLEQTRVEVESLDYYLDNKAIINELLNDIITKEAEDAKEKQEHYNLCIELEKNPNYIFTLKGTISKELSSTEKYKSCYFSGMDKGAITFNGGESTSELIKFRDGVKDGIRKKLELIKFSTETFNKINELLRSTKRREYEGIFAKFFNLRKKEASRIFLDKGEFYSGVEYGKILFTDAPKDTTKMNELYANRQKLDETFKQLLEKNQKYQSLSDKHRKEFNDLLDTIRTEENIDILSEILDERQSKAKELSKTTKEFENYFSQTELADIKKGSIPFNFSITSNNPKLDLSQNFYNFRKKTDEMLNKDESKKNLDKPLSAELDKILTSIRMSEVESIKKQLGPVKLPLNAKNPSNINALLNLLLQTPKINANVAGIVLDPTIFKEGSIERQLLARFNDTRKMENNSPHSSFMLLCSSYDFVMNKKLKDERSDDEKLNKYKSVEREKLQPIPFVLDESNLVASEGKSLDILKQTPEYLLLEEVNKNIGKTPTEVGLKKETKFLPLDKNMNVCDAFLFLDETQRQKKLAQIQTAQANKAAQQSGSTQSLQDKQPTSESTTEHLKSSEQQEKNVGELKISESQKQPNTARLKPRVDRKKREESSTSGKSSIPDVALQYQCDENVKKNPKSSKKIEGMGEADTLTDPFDTSKSAINISKTESSIQESTIILPPPTYSTVSEKQKTSRHKEPTTTRNSKEHNLYHKKDAMRTLINGEWKLIINDANGKSHKIHRHNKTKVQNVGESVRDAEQPITIPVAPNDSQEVGSHVQNLFQGREDNRFNNLFANRMELQQGIVNAINEQTIAKKEVIKKRFLLKDKVKDKKVFITKKITDINRSDSIGGEDGREELIATQIAAYVISGNLNTRKMETNFNALLETGLPTNGSKADKIKNRLSKVMDLLDVFYINVYNFRENHEEFEYDSNNVVHNLRENSSSDYYYNIKDNDNESKITINKNGFELYLRKRDEMNRGSLKDFQARARNIQQQNAGQIFSLLPSSQEQE
ncbi:MAG: hypothetical protein LBC92_05090, partial [Rickettsiales bacterium]|nr:hypothetical protein [Rickettsiales bacterium]